VVSLLQLCVLCGLCEKKKQNKPRSGEMFIGFVRRRFSNIIKKANIGATRCNPFSQAL
jgi:hypothetical protein